MKEILAFSGIREPSNLWSKLNFQNLDEVRNLNASILDTVAELCTVAQFKFGNFGFFMEAGHALIGSLYRDWGSYRFGNKLDFSNDQSRKNSSQIQKEQKTVKVSAELQIDIGNIRAERRESQPNSVTEIDRERSELLSELTSSSFNKQKFQKKYRAFCSKYKSDNELFQKRIIEPIQRGINDTLKKQTITEGDLQIIKANLSTYLDDVAFRIKNKTDYYHEELGFAKYNEVHLPPLLQFMEGSFILL